MPKEYELRYKNYNKNQIIKKLKDLGAIQIHKPIIYEYIVFHNPLNTNDTYIRLRKEYNNVTFTYKTNLNDKFVEEHEVIVSDYDTMLNMLYMLGFKKNMRFLLLQKKNCSKWQGLS